MREVVIWPCSSYPVRPLGSQSSSSAGKSWGSGKNLQDIQAEEIMTPYPYCVEEHVSGEEVIQELIEHRILKIPVVREKKLVGMITRTDILSHILEPDLIGFVH
jgi:CBS domain-containing protein